MSHIIRSLVFSNPIIVVRPKKIPRYEGVAEQGKYVEFRDGFAEVDDESFELISKSPHWGTHYIEVEERGIPLNSPIKVGVKGMGEILDSKQENKTEKKLEKLTESVEKLSQALTFLLEKEEVKNEENEPEQTIEKKKRGRPSKKEEENVKVENEE